MCDGLNIPNPRCVCQKCSKTKVTLYHSEFCFTLGSTSKTSTFTPMILIFEFKFIKFHTHQDLVDVNYVYFILHWHGRLPPGEFNTADPSRCFSREMAVGICQRERLSKTNTLLYIGIWYQMNQLSRAPTFPDKISRLSCSFAVITRAAYGGSES